MIHDLKRKLFGKNASVSAESRVPQKFADLVPSPRAPSSTAPSSTIASSEVASEQLDGIRLKLGALLKEPPSVFASSQNIDLVQAVHGELARIKTFAAPERRGNRLGAEFVSEGVFIPEGVTILHERERTVLQSKGARTSNSRDERAPYEAPSLRLSDGTLVSVEIAEQLLRQLSALHDEQQGKSLVLELLGDLGGTHSRCTALEEKLAVLEGEREERTERALALAGQLEQLSSAVSRLV